MLGRQKAELAVTQAWRAELLALTGQGKMAQTLAHRPERMGLRRRAERSPHPLPHKPPNHP